MRKVKQSKVDVLNGVTGDLVFRFDADDPVAVGESVDLDGTVYEVAEIGALSTPGESGELAARAQRRAGITRWSFLLGDGKRIVVTVDSDDLAIAAIIERAATDNGLEFERLP